MNFSKWLVIGEGRELAGNIRKGAQLRKLVVELQRLILINSNATFFPYLLFRASFMRWKCRLLELMLYYYSTSHDIERVVLYLHTLFNIGNCQRTNVHMKAAFPFLHPIRKLS